MIVQVDGKNGEKIFQYQEPTPQEKYDYFQEVLITLKDYLESAQVDISDIEIDFKLINEVNIRVDKRKDYYIIYHKETHLNEIRKSGLVAYWILKFKPLLLKTTTDTNYDKNINCGFAIYVMLSAIDEYINRKTNGQKKLVISKEYLDKLKYAFKYWDLSKEAIMLIADAIYDSSMNVGE